MLKVLAQSLVIAAAAAGIAAVDLTLRPLHARAVPTPPRAPDSTSSPEPAPEAKSSKIDTERAYELYQQGAVFLDARPAEQFHAGHIPQALSLPVEAWSGQDPAIVRGVLDQIDPAQTIVVYCGGDDCHASEMSASYLNQAGFSSVFVLEGGMPGWEKAGREVERAGP